MAELKLVVKQDVTPELSILLNILIKKTRSNDISCSELWQEIQHIDVLFDDDYEVSDAHGVQAKYSVIDDAVEFRNGDGTILFYVCN